MEKIACFDNGGETFDRFTAVYTGPCADGRGGFYFMYYGISENPFHPQGFGQYGELVNLPPQDQENTYLGKRIAFEDIPEDCQKLVIHAFLQ